MRQKIALFAEGLLAMGFRANERTLTRLESQAESVWRGECTYMEALMNLESPGARVLFVAAVKLAHERFHASVRQFVRLKVALCDEVLLALRAREGSLAGVRAHVGLQVARFLKLLQAPFEGTN